MGQYEEGSAQGGGTVALDDYGDYGDAAYDDGQYGEEGYDSYYDPSTGQPVGGDGNKVVVKTAEEKHTVDEQIRGKIELDTFSRSWSCRQCGYSNSRKEVVYKHVDTKHMEVVYRCDNCHRLAPTQHALKEHTRTYHKDAPVISSYS